MQRMSDLEDQVVSRVLDERLQDRNAELGGLGGDDRLRDVALVIGVFHRTYVPIATGGKWLYGAENGGFPTLGTKALHSRDRFLWSTPLAIDSPRVTGLIVLAVAVFLVIEGAILFLVFRS